MCVCICVYKVYISILCVHVIYIKGHTMNVIRVLGISIGGVYLV